MWPLQMQWDAPAVAMRVVKMCSSIPSVHLCPALVPIALLLRSLFVPLNVRFVCCYGNELVSIIWLSFLAPRPLTRIPILIRPLHVALLYSALQCTSNPPSAAFRPSP